MIIREAPRLFISSALSMGELRSAHGVGLTPLACGK